MVLQGPGVGQGLGNQAFCTNLRCCFGFVFFFGVFLFVCLSPPLLCIVFEIGFNNKAKPLQG